MCDIPVGPGKVLDFAVVLNVWHKDEEVQVARYDHTRRHSYTHLDLLDTQGKVDRKESWDHIPIEKAIRHAIDDFQENWEEVRTSLFRRERSPKARSSEKPSPKVVSPRLTECARCLPAYMAPSLFLGDFLCLAGSSSRTKQATTKPILFRHYPELVRPFHAERFFSISPASEATGKVVPMSA